MVMTSPATAFANQFTAFAVQAQVPLVPLAVNGTEVVYGFDETAERTQPDPLLKLRDVPLGGCAMLGVEEDGQDAAKGEAIEEARIFAEWMGMQDSANRFSDILEIVGKRCVGSNRFGTPASLWRQLSAKASEYGQGSAGHAELIDAAIFAILLSYDDCGKGGAIPFECVRFLNRAVFGLFNAGRFDGAAMLLESGSAASLSFFGSMEFFGRRTANAFLRSMTARKDHASVEYLLARGSWYGWFDRSGVSLEQFHLASAEQNFNIERYGACTADYVRMIGARLRRPEFTRADWQWIRDTLGITASMWEWVEGGSVKIEAARKLAADAGANMGAA